MEAKTPLARAIRGIWPLLVLGLGLFAIVLALDLFGDDLQKQSLTEALIRLVVVVGMYIFIGNSGVISFGIEGIFSLGITHLIQKT